MKLFLIHTGYYDKNIGDGFYEQHSNIFITAKDALSAREKVKKNKEDTKEMKNVLHQTCENVNRVKKFATLSPFVSVVENNDNTI